MRAKQTLKYPCSVELVTSNVKPVVNNPYQIRSKEQKKALEENIEKFLDFGVIEEGPSEWKTSLFVVRQKTNEKQRSMDPNVQVWRVVQDFTPLNIHVKEQENMLPLIADTFQVAQGKNVFSVIDLSKAFFHIKVDPSSRKYFGISYASKQLRMRSMPMGYKNSPSIFQRNMIECIMIPIQNAFNQRTKTTDQNVAIYMDDIFLATETKTQHLFLLQLLFSILAKYKLTVSIHKSLIGKRKVPLLGSIITNRGRIVQPERIAALQKFIPPRNVAELRQWMGSLRYIADHIPDLNMALRHFDKLTGNVPATRATLTPVSWTWERLKAFENVQQMIKQPRMLFHFDFNLPLFLETDASNEGFGAFLFQTRGEGDMEEVRPLAYYSKKWSSGPERAADPCRKELSALKQSVSKMGKLLYIYSFTIITDNQGVFYLVKNFAEGKAPGNHLLTRFLGIICSHNVKSIVHKSTKEVFTSDALSRSAHLELEMEGQDPTALPNLFD